MKLKVASIDDIERLLRVIYKPIPMLPDSVAQRLASAIPLIAAIVAAYLLSIAIFPFIYPALILDPLRNSGLFMLNIFLSRILFGMMALILIASFDHLIHKRIQGWYNLVYITLFHTFFALVVFNLLSLGLLLVEWYVLLSIKKSYVSMKV